MFSWMISNNHLLILTKPRFFNIIPTLKFLLRLPIFYCTKFNICCITTHALSLDKPFYLRKLFSHLSFTHFTPFSLVQSPLYNFISRKNQMAFGPFLMLHHFFGIIYLILFIPHPLMRF